MCREVRIDDLKEANYGAQTFNESRLLMEKMDGWMG
jgi:hypothetical protein